MSVEERAAGGEKRVASGEWAFSFLRSRFSILFTAYWIAKGVGWDNVPRRIYQSAMIRSGTLRRRLGKSSQQTKSTGIPHCQSDVLEAWLDRKKRFFPIPNTQTLNALELEDHWAESVTKVCTDANNGFYPFFSRWKGELGWPPNFNLDPVNNIEWPVDVHWLDSAKSGPPRNDIKLVWEASRFSLAYFLARDYAFRSDPHSAKMFWEMFDAWVSQNPTNRSVAWGCGQEIAFRLMAMLVGAFTTLDSPHSTSERLTTLQELCWRFATRIEANINYAISQENNHALSEAAGLWTVGLLFPEFTESTRWLELGKRVIESEIARQVYDDGSYVQHSMTYHRVMLDVMIWVIELGRRNDRDLSKPTLDRVRNATLWLREIIDPISGRVPNYGANDGANILPLACCDYLDFRPILYASSMSLKVPCDLPRGPWCEKAIWLLGHSPIPEKRVERISSSWEAPNGGYYVLKGLNSRLFIRAAKYRDRPSQCDMLHVDLWVHGQNILRDAGSFCYYHQDPTVKSFFYSVQAHNTIQVEGQEQMVKGPNFLWFHWPQGTAKFVGENRLECVANFKGPIAYTHCRAIQRNSDSYQIEDRVLGANRFTARWHLAPEMDWNSIGAGTYEAQLGTKGIVRIKIHSENGERATLSTGWESLYYGEKREIPVVEIPFVQGILTTTVQWSSP